MLRPLTIYRDNALIDPQDLRRTELVIISHLHDCARQHAAQGIELRAAVESTHRSLEAEDWQISEADLLRFYESRYEANQDVNLKSHFICHDLLVGYFIGRLDLIAKRDHCADL